MGLFSKDTRLVPLRGEKEFDCPACEGLNKCTIYSEEEVSMIFGVRLSGGEVRKLAMCGGCGNKFNLGGKEFDHPPKKFKPQSLKFLPPNDLALRHLLVGMAMADERLEDTEVRTVQEIYLALTGDDFSQQNIRQLAEKFGNSRSLMDGRLKRAGAILPLGGRELVFRALLMVSNTDGYRDPDEGAYIIKAARALALKENRWREIAREFD